MLIGLEIVLLLGFPDVDRISWSNRPVGAGDSVRSYPVGAGDSLSFYPIGAGCPLSRCPVVAGCSLLRCPVGARYLPSK
jgi:hypothetical protein